MSAIQLHECFRSRTRVSAVTWATFPSDVLERILGASSVGDLICTMLAAREYLATISGLLSYLLQTHPLQAEIWFMNCDQIRPCLEETIAHGVVRFTVPLAMRLSSTDFPAALLDVLPNVLRCRLDVVSIVGLPSLGEDMESALTQFPLEELCLDQLDTCDLPTFYRILEAHAHRLQTLRIGHKSIIHENLDLVLVRIVSCLPSSCKVFEVDPMVCPCRAFLGIPETIRHIGVLVLMMPTAGISLRKFEMSYSSMPHVRHLTARIGPGHYGEPTWGANGPQRLAAALKTKFNGLEVFAVEAVIESSKSPPLLDISKALQDVHIKLLVTELSAAPGGRASGGRLGCILGRLANAGVELVPKLAAETARLDEPSSATDETQLNFD